MSYRFFRHVSPLLPRQHRGVVDAAALPLQSAARRSAPRPVQPASLFRCAPASATLLMTPITPWTTSDLPPPRALILTVRLLPTDSRRIAAEFRRPSPLRTPVTSSPHTHLQLLHASALQRPPSTSSHITSRPVLLRRHPCALTSWPWSTTTAVPPSASPPRVLALLASAAVPHELILHNRVAITRTCSAAPAPLQLAPTPPSHPYRIERLHTLSGASTASSSPISPPPTPSPYPLLQLPPLHGITQHPSRHAAPPRPAPLPALYRAIGRLASLIFTGTSLAASSRWS